MYSFIWLCWVFVATCRIFDLPWGPGDLCVCVCVCVKVALVIMVRDREAWRAVVHGVTKS